VVSGGNPNEAGSDLVGATVMRDFLIQLGVNANDVLVEDLSRTTYENAVNCRRLLDEQHVHKVLLITDGVHMRRALACFRKQGIDAIPAGCNYRATRFVGSISSFLPDPEAAEWTGRASHEWLGLAWYWLRGRI
jgi:uncharacterized SAM-binding protein YcdF (DUF218 family)